MKKPKYIGQSDLTLTNRWKGGGEERGGRRLIKLYRFFPHRLCFLYPNRRRRGLEMFHNEGAACTFLTRPRTRLYPNETLWGFSEFTSKTLDFNHSVHTVLYGYTCFRCDRVYDKDAATFRRKRCSLCSVIHRHVLCLREHEKKEPGVCETWRRTAHSAQADGISFGKSSKEKNRSFVFSSNPLSVKSLER